MSAALSVLEEWRSPNFQQFQPLEVWITSCSSTRSRSAGGCLWPVSRWFFCSCTWRCSMGGTAFVAPLLLAPALARQLGSHVENSLGLWLDRYDRTRQTSERSAGSRWRLSPPYHCASASRISWMPSPPQRRSASPSHITSRGRFLIPISLMTIWSFQGSSPFSTAAPNSTATHSSNDMVKQSWGWATNCQRCSASTASLGRCSSGTVPR